MLTTSDIKKIPHALQWSQAGQRLAGQQPHWCDDVDYLTHCSDFRLVKDLQVNSRTDVMMSITSHTAVISGWSKTCRSTAALMWWCRLPHTLQWFQAGQRLAGQQPHWCDDVDYLTHCSDLRLVKDLQVNSRTDVMMSITSHTAVISGWSKTCRSTAALMWWCRLPHTLQWFQAGQRLAGQQPHWCDDVDYLTHCSDFRLVKDLQVNSRTDVMMSITSHTAVISGWSKTCRSAAALMWWCRLPHTLQWFQAGQRLAGQQPHWCDDVDYLTHCSDLRLVKDLQVNSRTDGMMSITSHTAVISGWSKTCRSTAALMWWCRLPHTLQWSQAGQRLSRSTAALMWWCRLPHTLQWSQAGQRLAGQQPHWCDDLYDELIYMAHKNFHTKPCAFTKPDAHGAYVWDLTS